MNPVDQSTECRSLVMFRRQLWVNVDDDQDQRVACHRVQALKLAGVPPSVGRAAGKGTLRSLTKEGAH